jgi:hypothetical protein
MKHRRCLKSVLFVVLILVVCSVQVSAQQSRGRGIYGDWAVKVEIKGETITFESILSFSRDQEGNQTGCFMNPMELRELKDVKFEDGKLSFSESRRNGDETTFTGTITDGVLSGTWTGDMRDRELKGKRSPRVPRAVGNWELTYSMGEREITSPLIIKADAQGQLSAQSPSERVEHTITDLAYERGELKFKRTTKMGERQFESTFAGRIQGNAITGTFTSQRGEAPVKGTRIGAAAIGTWILDVATDGRTLKQRLLVNPDMSGLYGPNPVKKINLEGNKLSFKATVEFGDNSYEIAFAGTVEEGKLTGERTIFNPPTTSRGTAKVTGTKVVRRSRRRN